MVSWLQAQFSCMTMCCFPCPQPSVQLCCSDRPDYIHFPQTSKLSQATIQMAFSVYTEKLKDCLLKKIHCLCILRTHTHAHTKTWTYMTLLELLFGSMFPGRVAKRIKTLMWSDAHFHVNTLSPKPLFTDSHSSLGSDHENPLPLTTYF